jgi:hypothetical protein|tara:strand:+ start:75 stop:476 length:402 start_codon:yes stop_codon:yes gene_type:complete
MAIITGLNSVYPKGMEGPNQYGFGVVENKMVISAATTNLNFLKKGRGSFYGISLSNSGMTPAFIRVFDKASAPVDADTPIATFCIQAKSQSNFFLSIPIKIELGLGLNITGVATIADATAIAANQVVGSVFYK